MAANGEEGIGSMGNDSPLAVLSSKNKPLYNYFKQMFAQVTNPPIDPIREAIVMSLVSFIGPKPNLLDINQVNPPMRLEVSQPVLDFADMAKLRDIEKHTHGKFSSAELDITYPLAWGKQAWRRAWPAVRAGGGRHQGRAQHPDHQRPRAERERVAIPALLALSAIHQHLVREGLRTTAGLVVETGSARGAPLRRAGRLRRRGRAPYLAMETLAAIHKDLPGELSRQGHLQLRQGDRQGPVQDHVQDGREHLHVLLRRPAVRGHRPEQRHGGQVLHRHRQPVEASACSRSPRRPSAATAPPSATTRCWPPCWSRRRVRLARPRRRAHVDARRDRQAAARHARRQLDTYKEYAQIINDQSKRHMTLRGLFEFKFDPARPFPSTRSSRPRRSSSALPPAPCRWAPSPPRPTPPWPWP
jgi:glutamate synthase (NADPH/NADH) large chain